MRVSLKTVALLLAAFAFAALFLPGRSWLLALTLGIGAIGSGLAVYRRPGSGPVRLSGALAAFVGATVTFVALTKVALTLAAVRHISLMLS